MPPAQPQQLSSFSFLARNSPVAVIAVGLILILVGAFLVVASKSRNAALLFAFFSPLPGIFALFTIMSAFRQLTQWATSSVAPRPAEFMGATSAGIAAGVFGIAATIVTMGLAITAVVRSHSGDPARHDS